MFTYDKPYAGGRCVEFYIEPLEYLMTCEFSEDKFKRISFR